MGRYTRFCERLALFRQDASTSLSPQSHKPLYSMVVGVLQKCAPQIVASNNSASNSVANESNWWLQFPTVLSMLLPALVPHTQHNNAITFSSSTDELEQRVVNTIAHLLDVPSQFCWPVAASSAEAKKKLLRATGVNNFLWPVASVTSSGDVVVAPDTTSHSALMLSGATSDKVFDFVKERDKKGSALAAHKTETETAPQHGGGVLHSSAVESYTVLLHTVRQQGQYRARGSASRQFVGKEDEERHQKRLTLYCSDQVNPLLLKAARLVGFTNIRVLQTVETKREKNFCLSMTELHEKVAEDLAHGLFPALIVATVGARCSGATDPLPALTQFCRRTGVWLHVDASHGGLALSTLQTEWKNALAHADSIQLSLFHSFLPFALTPSASRASLLFVSHVAKVGWALQQLEEARSADTVNRWREPHRGVCDRLSLLPLSERDGTSLLQQALFIEGIEKQERQRLLQAHIETVRALQHEIRSDGRFDAPLDSAPFGLVVFRWTMLADEMTEKLALVWRDILLGALQANDRKTSISSNEVDVHVGLVVLQKRLWVSVSLSQLPESPAERATAMEAVVRSLRVAADKVHHT